MPGRRFRRSNREETMNTELMYLVAVTALTGVMWVPYILDRIAVWGLADTVGYPENPKHQSPWARRMKAAHTNAVENLVVFAALVLAAHAAGVSNNATVLAFAVYFWARVVHFFAYTAAMPWVRTLAFVAGVFPPTALVWGLLLRLSAGDLCGLPAAVAAGWGPPGLLPRPPLPQPDHLRPLRAQRDV